MPTDVLSDAAIRNAIREASNVATLTIRFDLNTSHIEVAGPLQNPMLCLGMLEMAKSQIFHLLRRKADSPILTPSSPNGG